MMERGFKAEARRLAAEIRREVALGDDVAFDPWALAELYGIPVYALCELPEFGCSARAIDQLSSGPIFSAALVPLGSARLIIENDKHALVRRRASMAHEMSHLVLEHEFLEAILTDDGCRNWDRASEAEATWLAGEILVPFEAAKRAALAGVTDELVARTYGVSPAYARMRMNVTGVRKIASRSREKRGYAG